MEEGSYTDGSDVSQGELGKSGVCGGVGWRGAGCLMERARIETLATLGNVQGGNRDGILTPPLLLFLLLFLQGPKAGSRPGIPSPAPQAAGSNTSPPGQCPRDWEDMK